MSATLTFDYDSPLGTGGRSLALAPAGPKGDTGPAGPAPSGTGLVQVISGTASTLTHPDPSPAGSYTLASITVDSTGRVTSASSGTASGGTWGGITGTLSAQTDLQTALNAKQPLAAALTSWAAVTRASGYDTFAAVPSSANLAALLTDETGTGAAVFSASPTFTGTVVLSGATTSLGAAAQAHTLQQVAPASGAGNSLTIAGSAAASGNSAGGSVVLQPGAKSGSGSDGAVVVRRPGGTAGTDEIKLYDNSTTYSTVQAGSSVLTMGTTLAGALGDYLQISQNSTWVFRQSGSTRTSLLNGQLWLISSGFFGSGTTATVHDVTLSRASAGVWQMGTSAANALGSLNLTNLTASGVITLGTYTVATLPSAASNAGAFAQVTDANSTTNGTTVAGGGSNRVPVFSNGTNWIVK